MEMCPRRSDPWRHLLAIGACAGDWSAAAISRYGGVLLRAAERALDAARANGVLGADAMIDELERVQLLAELSIEHQSSIHAAVAYWAFSMGPDNQRTALEHARAAGTELAGDALIELLDRAGDADVMARAAVQYALPADWHAGDARAAGFLRRAKHLDLDGSSRTAVLATRSLVEMRIPPMDADGQQFASVTRPSVAQPLADAALTRSASHDGEGCILPLIA